MPSCVCGEVPPRRASWHQAGGGGPAAPAGARRAATRCFNWGRPGGKLRRENRPPPPRPAAAPGQETGQLAEHQRPAHALPLGRVGAGRAGRRGERGSKEGEAAAASSAGGSGATCTCRGGLVPVKGGHVPVWHSQAVGSLGSAQWPAPQQHCRPDRCRPLQAGARPSNHLPTNTLHTHDRHRHEQHTHAQMLQPRSCICTLKSTTACTAGRPQTARLAPPACQRRSSGCGRVGRGRAAAGGYGGGRRRCSCSPTTCCGRNARLQGLPNPPGPRDAPAAAPLCLALPPP